MRLIDADALLKTLKENNAPYREDINRAIIYAPTISHAKAEAFVDELINYIFTYPDDYMAMETLCRKLHKHGLIGRKDGEWTVMEGAEDETD